MKILIYIYLNNMNVINFCFIISVWFFYCENRLFGLLKVIVFLVCIFFMLLFVDCLNMYEIVFVVKSLNYKYVFKFGVVLMK